MRYRSMLLEVGLGVALVCQVTATVAQDFDSEALIQYRQGIMKAQGGLMAAMAQVVRGKIANEQDRLQTNAKALSSINQDIPALFPEGSDFGETDAKEEIWEDWDTFQDLAEDAKLAGMNFSKIAGERDPKAVAASFKSLADACKACHKKFRREEDE